MKESKVITFIGGFYIFGGIIALLSLLFNGSQLNLVFNLPNIPDYIVKLLLAIVYIPLGYLYIRRIKYSHWIILILAILTFFVSADLTTKLNTQPYIGIITTDQIKHHIMAKKSKDYYKDMLVLERAGKIGEKTIFNKEDNN